MVSVRTRRLLLWVALPALVLVLLYTVLGFFVVPRLIRSGVHDFVTKNYHREVAIGDVRFNPYTLRLDVNDFALPDADGQPMLAFRHLLVDVTVASIWRWGADFEQILLEKPFARVLIKADGSLNLSDLALPPSPDAKPEPTPNSKPARLFINHFSVQGGNVAFEDKAHPSEFRTEIQPITFDLRNFSTVGKDGGTYALSGASDAGERFSWSGSLTAAPLTSRGQFEVANLQAQTIWNYLRDSVHFELPSGVISIAGDYDFTAATTPVGLGVNVHNVTITDLGIRPKGVTEDYIKLARLEVHETRADVAKHTVDVGSVRLAGAEVRAWLMPGPGAGVLNLTELAGPAPGPAPSSAVPPPSSATPPPPSAVPPPSATPAQPAASPPPAATPPPTAPASTDAPAWAVSVPDIALDGIKILAEDRHLSPAVPLRLDDLSVHVDGFTTAHTTPIAVVISTKINGQGKFDAKADLSADFAAIKAQAELANLDLTLLQPYIAQKTSMTLRNGLLATKLNVERGADGHLAVGGEVDVTKLRTIDNELKRDFIKFERLQIVGIDYQTHPSTPSKPASLHIHNIVARAPYARVIIESDRSVNVGKVLSAPGGAAAATPPPDPTSAGATPTTADPSAAKPSKAARSSRSKAPPAPASVSGSGSASAPANDASMAIAIDAINIYDGSANYADFWIQPNFAVGIQSLNGSILGLSSSPRARAKVELQGKVDRYAPVHIWGETNPLAATTYSDIKMSFKGVELTSATPYSGHFAGYKIEKGKLSVDIDYKIENRKLTAAHKFVIDQLELGDRVESPDAIKLPLKIAIALLKDRNGVIDVDLPVTGSLDDPQFKVGPLIWKAVLNLLTKIATAPFALLGHLFGGGEQMNFIDFQPGSATLEQSEHDKLTALVKALKEKEKLELDVPVTFSADLDRPGLAAAHLNARLLSFSQGQAGGRKRGKGAARANAAPSAPQAAPTATPAATASSTASTGVPTPASNGAALAPAATVSPTPGANAASHAVPSDAPPLPDVVVTDPALTDPEQRYHLLVALYRTELGKDNELPAQAKAIEAAGKKKDAQPDFGSANAELEAALLQNVPVTDGELENLGKHRARAIQDVLLVGTDIDPSRVFIIGSASKGAIEKDKVRVELALK